MPPNVAAWLGTDPLPPVISPGPNNRPTFVTLGTIEARKNHMLLLNVWARLIERLGSSAPQLLIIGQRGWEATEVFQRLDHDDRLKGHVFELSNCSDDDLAGHLHSATALLFPSFAEGYGLPLVEALAVKVPVITTDLPVFRELCGDIPTYVAPEDMAGWEAKILNYAQPNSATRAAQLQRMESFQAPSWSDHFAAVAAWLDSLS
jgi:glycosyltransferase involved in cell wall biosynthesis